MRHHINALAVAVLLLGTAASPATAQTFEDLEARQEIIEGEAAAISGSQQTLTNELGAIQVDQETLDGRVTVLNEDVVALREDLEALRPDDPDDPDDPPVYQRTVVINNATEPELPLNAQRLQAAIDSTGGSSNDNKLTSTIFVPKGDHVLDGTVKVPISRRVVGEGRSTRLLCANGVEDGLTLESNNNDPFVHGGGILSMQVRNCDGAQIHVKSRAGELTIIDDVFVGGGEAGIRISGDAFSSTPLHIGRVSAFGSRNCIDVRTPARTHVQFLYVSGDNCRDAHVRVTQVRSFSYIGYKHERNAPPNVAIFSLEGWTDGGSAFFGPGTIFFHRGDHDDTDKPGTPIFKVDNFDPSRHSLVIHPVTYINGDVPAAKDYKGVVINGIEEVTVEELEGQYLFYGNANAGAENLTGALNAVQRAN